jgi:hypothetical protein
MLTLTCFGCSDQPKELHMKKALITTLIAATALTGGCASYGGGSAYDDGGFGYYDRASFERQQIVKAEGV